MTTKNNQLKIIAILISALFVLVPFHAAFVTIVGSQIDFKPVLQIWKEILIAVIVVLGFVAYLRDKTIFAFDRVNILAIGIIALSLIVSAFARPQTSVLLAGIKTNLVVLFLFLATQTVAKQFGRDKLERIILIPAALVGVIAILQPIIFTPAILTSIGYGTSSIEAGQYIEGSQSMLRVFSTLGGPNQLGAYLLIPLIFCLTLALRQKNWLWLIGFVGFCWPLYMTFSRSAWLGAVAGCLVAVLICFNKKIQLAVLASVIAVGLSGAIFLSQVNICTQFSSINTLLLHGDCSSGTLTGSDFQRLTSQKTGLDSALANPAGQGLGSAGPSSFFGSTPLITENWYLQIAIEIGLVGLALYIAFIALIASKLYVSSQANSVDSIISACLFAVIGGLAISSLFLHTLADSTLSILLFGLLGIQKARITK